MALNWLWKDKCGEITLVQKIDAEGNEKEFSAYSSALFSE